MRQSVVCVVPESASLFELATPSAVWGPNRSAVCNLDIDFIPCGIQSSTLPVEGGLDISGLGLLADHADQADLIIVPTWPIADRAVDPHLIDVLSHAHAAGTTIVGLCLGAFAIAATGLLDGQSATTHWRARTHFERLHPKVRYEPNTLYVDEGSLVTSAGSAAALDCCLHVLRRDHGAEAAANVARSLVTAPHRSGAQSQYAGSPPINRSTDPISEALSIAAENIASLRGVDDLAELAQTSRRSLERFMSARFGLSPRAWIEEQRIITACRLLESTALPIDQVAAAAGYGSAPTLRRAMQLKRATTPTAYRSTFRTESH